MQDQRFAGGVYRDRIPCIAGNRVQGHVECQIGTTAVSVCLKPNTVAGNRVVLYDRSKQAARRLELPPTDCLVIEDSLNGMHSAHAAGMAAWIVPNRVTSCLDFSKAERVLGSLEEVPSS